jgi:DNA-binding transcriptional LysR family regulator
MQIESLKIFCDLVEGQSFSMAAKRNHMTQSAVSQQLRRLEKLFKVQVVDRKQKNFCLTQEGVRLYANAKELLHLYHKMEAEVLEVGHVITGVVHLSVIYSVGLHELIPYVKYFKKEYSEVEVRVAYRQWEQVYEDVVNNVMDLGLVAFPVRHKNIEITPFREDRLVFVCKKDHPLYGRSIIRVKDLERCKYVGFEPSIPTRRALDNILHAHKISVEYVMEFDNTETVKRAIEVEEGVAAILPETPIMEEVQAGKYKAIPIEGDMFVRPTAILHKKGRVLTPALKKFVELLTTKNLVE